ncbi:hypothetical protein [Cellulophaga sp. HaHa_2_1]|uniref:hypothetical protein n=1 Tax=Cellulophaga sp. HaHa_2_1 TaxID=2749994 RepID=UPI001C4E407C|nr:hypothetical protein [Cellulophaga sp. HaHa_2_1]QXP51142.1 hypothetical protein H0I24_13430 [Cellulophaga sp. HaHa_2_1]
MTTFDELKTQWAEQDIIATPSQGHEAILKKVNFIKKKQKLTNGILTITIAILVAFFIYIAAYNQSMTAIGLALMITTLALRIRIELRSTKKIRSLEIAAEASAYKKNVTLYYQQRKKIHFIWTPILIVVYILGFVLLLPSFKENLSPGFFLYITISFPVIMVVLSTFIFKKISFELNLLQQLKQ